MEGFRFSTDVRVRFAETDAQRIAHNATYLVWFEVARVAYLDEFTAGYRAFQDAGYEATVVEAHVRYLAPAVFDDVMGYVNVIEGVAAYTYELTVRYLAGMPLGEPVVIRARMGECDWERRRSTITAEATLADGTVAADAHARFALVPRERFGL